MTASVDKAAGPKIAVDRSAAFQWLIVIITVVLVFGPLTPIAIQAFIDQPAYTGEGDFTLGNFVRLVNDPAFGHLIWNTIYFSGVATVLAQVSGGVMAIIIARTNLPGRRWFGEILLWPLFVSHLVIALGWSIMYGPSGYISLMFKSWFGVTPWNIYSLTGMAVVAGLSQAPLAFLMCAGAARNADARLEDAAQISGASPITALMKITLPMMRPAIVYSTLLNFVVFVEMLSIPLLFGGPNNIDTFTSFLYNKGLNNAVRPDYEMVAAAAMILLVIVLGLTWLQRRLTSKAGRFVTLGGKSARPKDIDLGPLKWLLFAVILAYVTVTIGVVFIGLFLRSGVSLLSPLLPLSRLATWSNYQTIFGHELYIRSITNSLIVAAVGAALGTALIACIALVAMRSQFKFRRALEYAALFPRSTPGIIAGLGFFYAVIWVPGMDAVRGTIWVLILAFIMRYIPVGFAAIVPGLTQIAPDLDKAGRISGADWLSTSHKIVLPLLKPVLFSAFALLFIHFFKEYVAAVFLYQPGSEIIGTTMLTLWYQGMTGEVAALATLQIILTGLFVYGMRSILGVKLYG